MKSPSRSNRRVSRRHFLGGTTAGLAASLLVPSGSTAEAQRRGGGAPEDTRPQPPMQPRPASFPGTGRYLYVTNDRASVDFFKIQRAASLVWSFTYEPDDSGRICSEPRPSWCSPRSWLTNGRRVRHARQNPLLVTRENMGLRPPDPTHRHCDGALYDP